MLQALSLAVTRERKRRIGDAVESHVPSSAVEGKFREDVLLGGGTALVDDDAEDWNIVVTKEDVEQACRLQVRGHLTLSRLERRVIPKRGLGDLVMSETLAITLHALVSFERGRRVLTSQWGFDIEDNQVRCSLKCVVWLYVWAAP